MHNRSTSLDSLASTSSSLLHRPGSSVVPTQRKRVLIPFVLLLSIVLAIHFTSSTDSSPASYATGAVEALKGWTGTSTTAPAEVKGEGGGQGSVEVDPLKDVVEEEEVDLDLEEEDVVLEGVEQFEVDWSERERKLRGLKFETSSVDPSLTAVLNELTLVRFPSFFSFRDRKLTFFTDTRKSERTKDSSMAFLYSTLCSKRNWSRFRS